MRFIKNPIRRTVCCIAFIAVGSFSSFEGQTIPVHLRTGYERAVIFPEHVILHSIDGQNVQMEQSGNQLIVDSQLANCRIEIDSDVVGFSPLSRFSEKLLVFTGNETGTLYKLHVQSSPTGRRQPIEIKN